MQPIEQLSAEQLHRLLNDEGQALTPEQVIELKQFIERIGGIENARQAVAMLRELEDAA